MPKSDRDIAESMLESLKRKGIEIRLNAYALSVYDTADGVTLTYTDNADGTPYFWKETPCYLPPAQANDRRAQSARGRHTHRRSGAVIVNGIFRLLPHIWAMET